MRSRPDGGASSPSTRPTSASGQSSRKAGAPGERLADLLEQQDLGGAEEEKAPSPASVSEQLHRVQEAGLLLHFVEDHEAGRVIEPSHGIGRQAQTFVRVVEREVDPCRPTGRWQQVTDQRRLAGLACAGEERDRAFGNPVQEQAHQPPRMQEHRRTLSASLQDFKEILQCR